jgi:hypothetical protein
VSPGDRATLDRLRDVLSDRAPLSEVPRLFTPTVELHWGQREFQSSPSGWVAWVEALRERGRMSELEAVVHQLTPMDDGRIRGEGCWRGLVEGELMEGPPVVVLYRLRDHRIDALWTGWENYAWVFGADPDSRWHMWRILGAHALRTRWARSGR